MTQSVTVACQQLTLPGCEATSSRDTGGITGGERDRTIRISFVFDPGLWPDGGPQAPDMFWEYYTNDEVAEGYLEEVEHAARARLEGLYPG